MGTSAEQHLGGTKATLLIQGLLLVGGDGQVAGRVRDARQHEPVIHLSVVQEGLVALINGAVLHLAGAARAGTGPAGVWQVQSSLLSGVQDVRVVCTTRATGLGRQQIPVTET